MTGEPVSFEGRHIQLHDAQMRPLPVQQPHPPIWIGGSGRKRTLPIVAKYADAWHTWGGPKQMAEMSAIIDRHAEEAGRDPKAITRASSLSLSDVPLDTVRHHIDKMAEVGVTYLYCGWPGEGRGRIEEFATQVMPHYTS
jgi:alkanesulfonate monooxygenase SsuD/methylene tetrahydromethanopterin reductase-like flavin-dependent oxidoreductase (luciferase family)